MGLGAGVTCTPRLCHPPCSADRTPWILDFLLACGLFRGVQVRCVKAVPPMGAPGCVHVLFLRGCTVTLQSGRLKLVQASFCPDSTANQPREQERS